ncbi:MAG: tyrosine-type recombinase/integrase [Pseudomonadota bacterium]
MKSSQLEFVPIFPAAADLNDSEDFNHTYFHANDFQAARLFLLSYSNNEATFRAYRSELEKFCQWLFFSAQVRLADVQPEDIRSYANFLRRPPVSWTSKIQHPRFVQNQGQTIPNPDWRPFTRAAKAQASQETLAASLRRLSSLYEFLVEENFCAKNPVKRLRQKNQLITRVQTKAQVRRLSDMQWAFVIEFAEKQANENPQLERTLFIVSLLYGMYLRISELTVNERWSPQMSHFWRDQDKQWWFKTIGKGNKERDISVSDTVLAALRRYREHLNLSPFPVQNEAFPLVPSHQSGQGISSSRQIRRLVQCCFDGAYALMVEEGLEQDAEELKVATVHWLRHTGISDDVKHRPHEHVRDDAGHSSSLITDRYIDIDRRERHESARNKPMTR